MLTVEFINSNRNKYRFYSVKYSFQELWEDFVSLIYPRCCKACDLPLVKGEQHVCTRCMLELPRTNFHQDRLNPLYLRIHGRVRIEMAMAFFFFMKGGRVQRLLHELKYQNDPELGTHLGRAYGNVLRAEPFSRRIDRIIPVPLHPSRLRKRGYNQSEMFARGLSEQLDRPVDVSSLVRLTRTETQTRKGILTRWENMKDVFSVSYPEPLLHSRVLLVDDVITTGATIEACAEVLLRAGCYSVTIAGIAYADK